jgi:hypothetical protein
MSHALLGLAFLLFGAVSVWDANRIASTIRLRGTLDVVGPDRYLLGVAVLLIVVGALLVVDGIVAARRRAVRTVGATARAPGAATVEEGGYAHFALMAALLAYALLMPVAGYAAATLAFLVAVFRIMGIRSWTRTIVASLLLTALFFVSFTELADLPLPKGWHGLG